MSFPGFALARQGPVRIGGTHSDFNLFTYLGSPFYLGTLGSSGVVRAILEADFLASGVTYIPRTGETSSSVTWAGAFRTGAWPSGTHVELYISPGARIYGRPGSGGIGRTSSSVGGFTSGGGGGGSGGVSGGLGGSASPLATPGANGTTTTAGVGGVGAATASPGFISDTIGDDGGHAIVIDNNVVLDLFNFGTVFGGGPGGNGGAGGGGGANGAFPTTSFFLSTHGMPSCWCRYGTGVLNKFVGGSYPNAWGYERNAISGDAGPVTGP